MTEWPPPHFFLDEDTRVLQGGKLLLGGYPIRAISLSSAGAIALSRALGGTLDDPSVAEVALMARLAEAGFIHPQFGPEVRGRVPSAGPRMDVTLVIPARDEELRIADLVSSLAPTVAKVLVVDDGSRDRTAELAAEAGARVLRHVKSAGPGAARNLALAEVETPYVAFIDADCLPPEPGWLDQLLPHLQAPHTVAVAPRIRGADGPGLIAEYERGSCPLDMGARPSPVGLGRRVPYVPSAALVASIEALKSIGGFNAGLRYGEDVDLIWRLNQAGLVCRYEPSVEVRHRPRPSIVGFACQHFNYGTSALKLESRHPGALAPIQGSAPTLVAALSTPIAGPLPSLALSIHTARRLRRVLPQLAARQALATALAGPLATSAALARALAREWMPISIVAATRRGGARRLALLGLASLIGSEAAKGRAISTLAPRLFLGLLARLAYCVVLWAAALRKPRALLPVLIGRPKSTRQSLPGPDIAKLTDSEVQ